MAREPFTPLASICRTSGRTFAAKASAAARLAVAPFALASARLVRLPSTTPWGFLLCQGSAGSIGNQRPLFLGQGGVNVQHERVRGGAQFGHEERQPLRHEAGNEMRIAEFAIDVAVNIIGASQC
jgi:hypothetical protein